jgi:hypothetical protein
VSYAPKRANVLCVSPRQRPPIEDLHRLAEEHLLYEAGCIGAARIPDERQRPHAVTGKLMKRHHKDDPVVENALLDSFAIHVRNVIDFLFVKEPKVATDAVAADYFDDDWEPLEQSDHLARVKDRVGKEVVHLSYNQLAIPEDEKGWQVIGIGPEILSAFVAFAESVPAESVPEGWRDRAYAATIAAPDLWVQPLSVPAVATQGLPPPE